MTAALATLNRAALVALEDCEQRIERGLRTFIEVGAALAAIRDNKLYRGTHETFEAYCRERWNMTPQHANRLALAAGVVTSMEPIGSIQPPTNEGQARALAAAPEAERADVWREAVERTDGKPTAKVIGEVLKERTTPAEPDRKPLGAQSLVPEPIAEHYETSAWKDDTGPGGCGIECACGVTYDGFDTLADAAEHMGRHIETPGPVDADGAPPADPGATPEPADVPSTAPAGSGTTSPAPEPEWLGRLGEDYKTDPAERIADVAEVAPEYVKPVTERFQYTCFGCGKPFVAAEGDNVCPSCGGCGTNCKPVTAPTLRIEPTADEKQRAVQRDARALLLRVVELLSPTGGKPDYIETWARKLGPYDDELAALVQRAGDAMAALDDLISEAGK